ncbi:DUF3348 family protein [Aquabacterium sp.]|uniref:DUF3348 family protein n=1 Tax=Aquabacterium sp. TaxID=1872578 RepID=UPI00248740FE|nr:DUF3348 family protein [Aquabacterium sp.]MDI1347970.1 DUF3348 family protein [Aquabacterium sp.]
MSAPVSLPPAAAPKTAMPAVRANFASSRLVRLLSAATAREQDAPRQDFAERLAQWLSAVDTVRLHAALPPGPVGAIPTNLSAGAKALRERTDAELAQVRAALTQGIATQAAQALRDAPHEADAGHAPHRKRHLDQQGQMAQKVAALRASVRQALSQASPRLRQLAALDAALEQTLGGREHKLMAAVPLLLEKRFEQLKRAQPEGWHGAYVGEMQEMLHAELDLRLQPVIGLMHALRSEVEKHP